MQAVIGNDNADIRYEYNEAEMRDIAGKLDQLEFYVERTEKEELDSAYLRKLIHGVVYAFGIRTHRGKKILQTD
jgi:hypothetical protein